MRYQQCTQGGGVSIQIGVVAMADKKLSKGITKRPDGRYMGRFQMFGERYTVYGRTVKEVAALMEETRYEVKHGIYCKPNEATVKSWFDTWIKEYKENTVKESTIQRYLHSFKLYVAPKLGKCRVCDVQPQMIQKLINDMHKKGYSKSQIKIVYAVIKGMFDQAILKEGRQEQPYGIRQSEMIFKK